MDYLPVFIDIRSRDCLVVGGGEVAARKVDLLCRAGGRPTVLSPNLSPGLERRERANEVRWLRKPFADADVDGYALVIAATDDRDVNARVAHAARARGIPINVVDTPGLSTFIFPSIVDRSPILIAVSTGGASPILARMLRARLEALIPAAYGQLAALLQRSRQAVRERIANSRARRRFWEDLLDGPIPELVFSRRMTEAEERLQAALRETDAAALQRGEVYLIGAGPGDPDLLTFRALRLMQRADVVLYDRLVPPPILDLVRREAQRVYVGKKRDFPSVRQEEINRILVELAQQGKRVVRLKGGDPFIFGRGGEEIATLAREGITFESCPVSRPRTAAQPMRESL